MLENLVNMIHKAGKLEWMTFMIFKCPVLRVRCVLCVYS